MRFGVVAVIVTAVIAALAAALAAACSGTVPCDKLEASMLPQAKDYGFMWWANGWWWGDGWTGRSPDGRRLLAVQAGRAGMVLDVERMDVPHLGLLDNLPPYEQAGPWVQGALTALPAGKLDLQIVVGQTAYTCHGAAGGQWGSDHLGSPLSLVESGRYLNHYRIERLVFTDPAGSELPARAKLEIIAWPGEITLRLVATPTTDLSDARLVVGLTGQGVQADAQDEPGPWQGGQDRQVELTLAATDEGLRRRSEQPPMAKMTVAQIGGEQAVESHWDSVLRAQAVEVPLVEDGPARLRVELENPSAPPLTTRLVFYRQGKVGGITGPCPVVRGLDGEPLGLPLQISKNWHRTQGHPILDEGAWLRVATQVHLEPKGRTRFEFTLLDGWWGTLPSVSHAQLCLIGWGVNQRWDQVAIGDWGETITYDPEINLMRSIIDDVRPLLVMSMSQRAQYGWTNNVGGGDFLVYLRPDSKGQPVRQSLVGMRATYDRIGPNLTRALYHGTTADGAIAAEVEVGTPRCDDLARHYHRFRYDVLRPTEFARLAFYQLGADNYNDHTFERMAIGNAGGITDQWSPPKGHKTYSLTCIPLAGKAPWVALCQADGKRDRGGAWANRGMVVRSWRARLGGQDVPTPCISVYGSENGPASALVELAPPAGLTRLEPGDFVEATVELLTPPQQAEDYYGPNQPLRASLQQHPDSWHEVHRQAAGNNLRVTVCAGRLVRAYPPVVEVDGQQQARVEIAGGVGYVPITFTGLTSPPGHDLYITTAGRRVRLDQSKIGNDFWQVDWDAATGRFSRTYTLPMDRADQASPIDVELKVVPPGPQSVR